MGELERDLENGISQPKGTTLPILLVRELPSPLT